MNLVINSKEKIREISDKLRKEGRSIALVPTMGALHKGHLELVKKAQELADVVIVSIFVNPTQFAPNEDLDKYPRTLEADLEALDSVGGVDFVFQPSEGQMYDDNHSIWIEPGELADGLCGEHRPGHFRGVCTIVYKLFKACNPSIALFGLKDAQQFVIINALVRDLEMSIEIVGVETVREKDGLALSSRNRYLDSKQRQNASGIRRAILTAVEEIGQGEQQIPAIVESSRKMIEQIEGAKLQYFDLVSAETLKPSVSISKGDKLLIAAAVYFGQTRLIDNAFLSAP